MFENVSTMSSILSTEILVVFAFLGHSEFSENSHEIAQKGM